MKIALNFLLVNLFIVQLAFSQTNIVVDNTQVVTTSKFQWGQSIIDGSFGGWNPANSLNNAIGLLKGSPSYVNLQIMAWGAGDPWADSSKVDPYDYAYLDRIIGIANNADCTPVLTLCEAPWWMKGQLNADGSTTLLTAADEWKDIAYNSRILDNKMNKWLHLVRRIAERYMVSPYNVRYFQVWNELKGYYNPKTNNSDYNSSAGEPLGYNAKHGYTYMYNKVYDLIKIVAAEQGIDPAMVCVGGPYPVMMSENSSAVMSHPSNISGAWGVMDKRSLDALSYWLNNKNGGEFISLDGGNEHKSTTSLVNSFEMCDKYKAVNDWVRAQTQGKSIPIWWSEMYVHLNGLANTEAVYNALGAYSSLKMIVSDASVALLWGNYEGNYCMPPLWTKTDINNGGTPYKWYYTTKIINSDFGPGSTICKSSSSSSDVAVIATDSKAMVINKTDLSQPIILNGSVLSSLTPYEVRFIDYNSTGINTIDEGTSIYSAYPTIAKETIKLTSKTVLGNVSIVNSTGELVFCNYFKTSNTEINISKFPSGLYLFKLNNGLKVIKFIKE